MKSLRDTWLRIDARSLGLFRLAFGAVLICDWARRYRWIKEFYSNDGVLPNHNHIFLLHEQTRMWSALHAFSSPGENAFAFWVILAVYVGFLIGVQTRAFHFISLVALVSLTGRDILMENAGNYLAIALLAFTLFLPLGSRFSVDALRRSLDERDEKDGDELNNADPSVDEVAAKRLWGWSPSSIAAFAVLAQICIMHVVHAYQRSGSWFDGTALHYALAGNMSVSRLGAHAATLPSSLLGPWTHVLRFSELLVPALVLFPVLPRLGRFTRGAAVALSVVYGVSFGLLFEYGLFGWSIVAASALFIAPESWNQRLAPARGREVTVIYDADCGVCLWICRVLRRLDLRGHLAFQGNDALANLVTRRDGALESKEMPAEITPELVLETVVSVSADGRVHKRGDAVATAIRALPLGFLVAIPMRLPGVSALLDLAYDYVAARRQSISVLMGKEACGIPMAAQPAPEVAAGYRDAAKGEGDESLVAPATRAARILVGGAREIAALVIFLAMIAQTGHANPVPGLIPLSRSLAAIAQWPRMIARWDVLEPEPSRECEFFVLDAQTKGGKPIDPFTGKAPEFGAVAHGPLDLGQLWADYLTRVHEKDWNEFQRAFRDYLNKGGPRWQNPLGDDGIAGYDAYWVREPIPAPGEPPFVPPAERDPNDGSREKLFSFSRGGKTGNVRVPPTPFMPRVHAKP